MGFMKTTLIRSVVLASGLLLVAPGCTTLTGMFGGLTSPSTTQARTLAEALQGAKIATDTVDFAVRNHPMSQATYQQMNKLNEAVHTALEDLYKANAAGQSLSFAAFNVAYDAFVAYSAQNGIPLAGGK